jgi:hypothetical protein
MGTTFFLIFGTHKRKISKYAKFVADVECFGTKKEVNSLKMEMIM